MNAYDIDLEMKILRSAVASPTRMSELRSLGGKNLFSFTAALKIFNRANRIIQTTGQAPKWNELCHDARIPESIRDIMPEQRKPIKKFKEFKRSANQLIDYARIRAGAGAALEISELMKEESVDPDEITAILAKGASESQEIVAVSYTHLTLPTIYSV